MIKTFEISPQTEKDNDLIEKEKASDRSVETVYKFLEYTGFSEIRKDDTRFENFIQSTSYEEISTYLNRINGALRGIASKYHERDGGDVTISQTMVDEKMVQYLPPSADSKENWLRETFNTIKKIPDNEDRALLSFYAVQAIHPYNDGNGRVGRLAYKLISEEGKSISQSELLSILSHEKKGYEGVGIGRDLFAEKVLEPEKAFDLINREIAKNIAGENFINKYGRASFGFYVGKSFLPKSIEKELSEEKAKKIKSILAESSPQNFSFRSLIILKLINEDSGLEKYTFKVNTTMGEKAASCSEDVGKEIFGFDGEEFMNNLTLEQANRVLELHKEIKDVFMEQLIDIFQYPNNHTTKNNQDKEISIKELFRREL